MNKHNDRISAFEKENKKFYKSLSSVKNKLISKSFEKQDDIDLSEEQINEINSFWKKYEFAYPQVDYDHFKTMINRSGKFSPLYCPAAIRKIFFDQVFNDIHYSTCFQNKGLLEKNLPNIKQPRTIARKYNHIYFDSDYNHITGKQIVDICMKELQNGKELIVKPNGKGGGKGIVFINKPSREVVVKGIKDQGTSAFVIQEVLKQSETMKKLNPGSVNTIRVTSLFHKNDVKILAAVIRVGDIESRVDNRCSGGTVIGMDVKTGECNNWALTNSNDRIDILPSGVNLCTREIQIPNVKKIWEFVKCAHYQFSYIRLISWDIALDQDDEPVLIEANFAGMLQLHEATTGPVFGEYMEELLDECILEKFYLLKATKEYNYKEYYDHIELEKYAGDKKKTIVPEVIEDKPVTLIAKDCFKGCRKNTKVIVSRNLYENNEISFTKRIQTIVQ